MRAAAIQLDVRRDDPEHDLARAERLLRAAAARGVELCVLPEMWPTSFPGPRSDVPALVAATERALERVARLSRELSLVVAGSGFGPGRDGAPPANRFTCFDRGELAFAYDKVHLFSPTAEHESFSAGDAPPPTADTSVGRLSGLVCYDLRFPELTRRSFLDGAEIVAVSAQWPEPRAGHFRALCRGLAVQNQCFVVACNRTGRDVVGRRELELVFPGGSTVVDPSGSVLAEGDAAEGLVEAEVDLRLVRDLRRTVPVARDRRPDAYRRWADPASSAPPRIRDRSRGEDPDR
jgi:omega-amidase